MDILTAFFRSINWDRLLATGLRILLILVAAWVAVRLLRKLLARLEQYLIRRGAAEEPPTEAAKRVETLVKLIRQAALIGLWAMAALVLLRELGVDIGPILASAGVAGLAVGFGAQNLVRDVIAGFFFILENQVRVGDVAVVNGTGGLVEALSFRTLVLRDQSGAVHIFPHGAVQTLSNLTNEWSAYVFDIGVSYKENTDRVIEVMKKVGAELKRDPALGPHMLEEPEIFGVEKLDSLGVTIKGRIKTQPIRQWDVGREYLRRIKLAFDEQGIEFPIPRQVLSLAETGRPLELRRRPEQAAGLKTAGPRPAQADPLKSRDSR